MKLIESDIIKIPNWDKVQGFDRNEDIKCRINNSLLEKFKDGLVLQITDEHIVCDTTNDKYWDGYQFK